MEIWKSIAGYEGLYEVSSLGRVRNILKSKILTLTTLASGYVLVTLAKNNKSKKFYVHRIVAQAFVPNLNNYLEVNHIDEDKSNNSADNLEWCTHKYNVNYGTRNQRISANKKGLTHKGSAQIKRRKPVVQLTLAGSKVAEFQSLCEAEQVTRICRRNICNVCKGRYESAGNFKWMYKSDYLEQTRLS